MAWSRVAAGCPERRDALSAQTLRDVKPHSLLKPAMPIHRSCTGISGKLANDHDVGFQNRHCTAKRTCDCHGFEVAAHRLTSRDAATNPSSIPKPTHRLAKTCVERTAIRGDIRNPQRWIMHADGRTNGGQLGMQHANDDWGAWERFFAVARV
jgi:hypothetical protein